MTKASEILNLIPKAVDERTAYMVNPNDYAPFATKWNEFKKSFDNLKMSQKGTDDQQKEFKVLTRKMTDLMGEINDMVRGFGDTEEVTGG